MVTMSLSEKGGWDFLSLTSRLILLLRLDCIRSPVARAFQFSLIPLFNPTSFSVALVDFLWNSAASRRFV